jgi:hypothetical protein
VDLVRFINLMKPARSFEMYQSDEDDRELLFETLKLEPLRKTSMPVAPCMERALGYPGFRRCVAFKVAGPDLIYWLDGIDHGFAEVGLLDRFLSHPLIAPHLRTCRLDGRAVEPEELTVFESSAQALRMTLEELGDVILLDREKRVVWTGLFIKAFWYLTLATALEDLPDDNEDEGDPYIVDYGLQFQLLGWLDLRLQDFQALSKRSRRFPPTQTRRPWRTLPGD